MTGGFLTKTQREKLESGELSRMDRTRIRKRFGQAVEDMNLLIENRETVDPQDDSRAKTLEDYTSPDDLHLLMYGLLGLFGDNHKNLGENGGRKQEVAVDMFLEAFHNYEPGQVDEYKTKPHPSEIDGFQEAVDVIHSFYE